MKNLFQDLKASIYSSDFVSRFRVRSVERSAFFVLILCSISGLVATAAALVVLVPGVWMFFNSNMVADYYPEGLEVQITDGKVTTNVENPYVLPLSYYSDEPLEEGDPVNLLVIDTATTDPLTALETYDTMLLVSADKVVAQKSDGEIRAFTLEDVENLTITEESTRVFMEGIMPWLVGGAIFLVIFIAILVIFFVFLYNMVVLLGLACVVWVVGKIRKLNFSYKESYVLAAYSLTLPMLLSLINTSFFNFEAPVFLLAFLAVLIVNVLNATSKKTPAVVE